MNISRTFLDRIAAECGSSYYLLDSNCFKENFKQLTIAFRNYYPNTTIAYSYKTNYVPRYCEIVEQLGGYAEVVSSMEMMLALKFGVPANHIFFNGPYKEHEYAIMLLNAGGTVNIDSLEELIGIAQSANRHNGAPFKLGLRCNFDVHDGILSRFGFDVNSQTFIDAIKLIDDHPNLQLVGLHCHFATRQLSTWQHRTKGMISVIDRFFRDRLHDLQHISLGGGIYGQMPEELKAQFPIAIPEFEDYARESAKPFNDYFESQNTLHRPILIIEPGTAMVANALKYVCTVNSIKNIQKRTIITLTGSSYNINPNPNRKNVPIECFSNFQSTQREKVNDAYLAGYTCIEGDYLYKGYTGEIAVGDFVVFSDIGSYSIVMKPPFILPNVAIVEPLNNGKDFILIKRKETIDDIFQSYTAYEK